MKRFNWQIFFEAIGEGQVEVAKRDNAAMSQAVRSMLVWLLEVNDEAKPPGARTIARRLIGLAWTLDPSLLEGKSITAIAKELGCHKVVLSIHSAAAHRQFRIRNRGQSHGWNFKPTLVAPIETESEEHDDDTE